MLFCVAFVGISLVLNILHPNSADISTTKNHLQWHINHRVPTVIPTVTQIPVLAEKEPYMCIKKCIAAEPQAITHRTEDSGLRS